MTTISTVAHFAHNESSVLQDADQMTFVEAEIEIAALIEAAEKLDGQGKEAEREEFYNYELASDLNDCILKTPPKTLADALVILNSLTGDDYGIDVGVRVLHQPALENLRDFIAGLVPSQTT